MKPSHLTTPRQLSDCTWQTGHASADVGTGGAASYVLAVVIGIVGALLLAHWVAA